MKKSILTITMLLLTLVGFTQFSISTEGTLACGWNPETEEFDVECNTSEDVTIFSFNKAETMFQHQTMEMHSTYYVTGTEHSLKDDRNLYIYFATSDVGNRYVFFFDRKYNEVRAIPDTDSDDTWMATWFIKGVF